jgi:DNA-binding GntR family transcriptional regulator
MPIPTAQSSPSTPRVLLRERVHSAIRGAILDGTLHPGERLHDEQLIEWLGVSRTPIREAITHLASAGLIEMSANRYTKVAVPDHAHVVEALHTLGVLFGNISRFTVTSFTDEQRDAVASRLDEEIRLVRDHGVNDFAIASVDVYRAWLDACPNRGLVSAYQHSIDGLAYRLRVTELEAFVPKDHLCEQLDILRRAVLADDPIAAEQAMERIHMVPQRA